MTYQEMQQAEAAMQAAINAKPPRSAPKARFAIDLERARQNASFAMQAAGRKP